MKLKYYIQLVNGDIYKGDRINFTSRKENPKRKPSGLVVVTYKNKDKKIPSSLISRLFTVYSSNERGNCNGS